MTTPAPPSRRGGRSVNIRLHSVTNGTQKDEIITETKIFVSKSRWQKLIVPRSLVQNAIDNNHTVLTFRITCDNCTEDIYPVSVYKKSKRRKRNHRSRRYRERPRKRSKQKPFFILHVKSAISSSRKRQIHKRSIDQVECSTGSGRRKRCKRKYIYVNFRELGWDDWILEPRGYRSYYCDGTCGRRGRRRGNRSTPAPATSGMDWASQHPRLQQTIPPSHCCAATEQSALSIIQMTPEGNLVHSYLPRMITEKCGCI
jgi:hypothetical protein